MEGINKKTQAKEKVDARPGLAWVLHPPQEFMCYAGFTWKAIKNHFEPV